MPRTLLDLKEQAEQRFAAGKVTESLKIFRLVLEGAPLDFNLRLEIADALVGANQDRLAGTVYSAIADHDIKSGSPLRAIVAIKLLEMMGATIAPLIDSLIKKYAAGSEVLGRSVKLAPADYSVALRDDLEIDYEMPDKEVVESVAQMASFTGNIENYPPLVPPLAIFSTLEPESFSKLLGLLRLKRHHDGEAIINQGDTGDAIYFIARGEVRVVKTVTQPGGETEELQLARLGPGSLFGEMALVSADPRGASVVCDGLVDVLELTKEHADQAAAEMPHVGGAMRRFTQERMIQNLLATNPLFQPFDDDSKKQLLAKFTGHEVPKGTIFLEQGKPGTGLYVILQGQAEVLKWDGSEYIKLAILGPHDVAGEISLLHEEPATATVRTTSAATLLFLARELFSPLIEAVPELLTHFARLAQERLDDTEFKLMQSKVLDDDFIEKLEESDVLNEDDLVFI
ncbi:MAG: cyclic nucleotide-binding domain-containing protein [Deltaproteobacteria bacterium]|nr:cyclic nucleotide-binding domain-containing protein [Deltaproteobacteria bacterium]